MAITKQDDALQKLRGQVVGHMQGLFDNREPTLVRLPGILGKTNDRGSASVDGKPSYCYVRVGNDETLVIAYNNRTSHRNGLPVIVGYDPAQSDLFQVLSIRNVYGDDEDIIGGNVGRHHETHEWGDADADDVVYARIRQIHDLRVYATDPASMSVNISDGVYIIGQGVYYTASTTEDLTSVESGLSAAQMVWVLIAANADGIYTTTGTPGAVVDLTDIPEADDPNDWRLAAVLVKEGDTSLTDWPSESRIVDLRFAGARSSSSGGTGYVDFANAIVVAKSGGNYETIQEGVDNATVETRVIIMNGAFSENVLFDETYITVGGMLDQHRSGPYGCYMNGADDTGPILDIQGPGIWGNVVINRELTGGSGEYIGLRADQTTDYKILTDMRVHIGGGATGRNVYAVKIQTSGTKENSVSRSIFIAEDHGTGAALELSGTGGSSVFEVCQFTSQDGGDADAVQITGTGTHTFYKCEFTGDISISGAATVYFVDCTFWDGDIDITAAATVFVINGHLYSGEITSDGSGAWIGLRQAFISGNVTGAAGDEIHMQQADIRGTLSGFDYTGGSCNIGTSNWHWQSIDDDSPSYMRVAPTGTVSGSNRSAVAANFEDYIADSTNYEHVEIVAFDDGVTVGGLLRTKKGGTGTLQSLYIGTGDTILDMTKVTTANLWEFPGNIKVDTISELTGAAGVTIEGVHHEDGLVVLGETGGAQVSSEMLTVYIGVTGYGEGILIDASPDQMTLGYTSGGEWYIEVGDGGGNYPFTFDNDTGFVLCDPNIIMAAFPARTFTIALYDSIGADGVLVYDGDGYLLWSLESDNQFLFYDNAAEDTVASIAWGGASNVVFDINVYPVGASDIGDIRFFRSTDTTGAKRVQFLKGDNTTTTHAQIGVDGGSTYFSNTYIGFGAEGNPSYLTTFSTSGSGQFVGLRIDQDGYLAANHSHGIYMTVDGAVPSGYNAYGVNIASVTWGDQNYAIYASGGASGSYFAYNVGIAQLPSASYALYVYENAAGTYVMHIRQDYSAGVAYGLYIKNDATTYALRVECGSTATSLVVNQGGVGVGSATVSDRLTVTCASGEGAKIHNTWLGFNSVYGTAYACFSHWTNRATAGGYALLAAPTATYLNTLSGYIYFRIANTTKMEITSSRVTISVGKAFINDTSNAKMSYGLTINQGAYDNEVLAFKSSDVAHGMTTQAETDTYCFMRKYSAANGGLSIVGLGDAGDVGAAFSGISGTTPDETVSTAALGVTMIYAWYKNGTSTSSPSGNDNILVVMGGSAARFIFEADGDLKADHTVTSGAFDEYDDAQLVRAMALERSPAGLIRDAYDEFVEYNKQDLTDAGVLIFNNNGEVWRSYRRSMELHEGAIWQLYKGQMGVQDRVSDLEQRLDIYERALLQLGVEPESLLLT